MSRAERYYTNERHHLQNLDVDLFDLEQTEVSRLIKTCSKSRLKNDDVAPTKNTSTKKLSARKQLAKLAYQFDGT